MPRTVTTKSEQVWQSSDGQRTIWEVTLKTVDEGDKVHEYKLKTYSSKIAEVGFEGEVRSYVNPRGERFVRQVPDVNKQSGGRDDAAIKAQWAIGQAVSLFNTGDTSTVLREGDPATEAIQETAAVLFNMVNDIKGEQE